MTDISIESPSATAAAARERAQATTRSPFRKWFARIGWRHLVGVLALAFSLFPVVFIISSSLIGSANFTERGHQRNTAAFELHADAELYAAEQTAKARRVQADAEAYATGVVAAAIQDNGLEAAQYQVALKQVDALNALGGSQGSNTVIVPANALEAFGNAFKMLRGQS